MTSEPQGSAERYGPLSFVAALATIAVFETIAWGWFPYFLIALYFLGLASLIVLPVAVLLTQARGRVAQIGRGILIGSLATPLTVALIGVPVFVATQLLHLG